MSDKNWSEEIIEDILNTQGGEWRFVEMFQLSGKSTAQAKMYDPPAWIAYPDFEKTVNGKIILLVEVKGYNDFFNHQKDTVAMKHYQYAQYFVAQRKECSEIRVVFVIRKRGKLLFFWETLNNMSKMENGLMLFQ